jgi:hypothetical protein
MPSRVMSTGAYAAKVAAAKVAAAKVAAAKVAERNAKKWVDDCKRGD